MSVVGHVEEEEEAIVYGDWPTSGRGSPGAIRVHTVTQWFKIKKDRTKLHFVESLKSDSKSD